MISSALNQLHLELPASFPVNPIIGESTYCQLTSAFEHYHQSLLNDDSALGYIVGRGISVNTIEQYRLGFGDRTLLQQITGEKKRKLVRRSLQCTGFIKPNGREIFRGCISFPVKRLNLIVGGYGRLRARNCCWGSSPYTYHLIEEDTLFNQDILESRPKSIVLVKSPLEAVSLIQVYPEPCIGLIHLPLLTDEQIALLNHSGVKLVKICINPTEFWQKKISQIAIKLLSVGIRVKVVALPVWHDVNQLLQDARGDKVLIKLIQHAQKWQGGSNATY